jgi:phosphomannomutase
VTGMALLLQYLLESGKSLSELVAEIPRYHMVKSKVECDRTGIHSALRELEKCADCEEIDTQDGLKLIWRDHWIHLRASNTEPVLRFIAEARTQKQAKALVAEYSEKLAGLMQPTG